MLLVLAAILGVLIFAAPFGFLALVSYLQKEIFTHLPRGLGFSTEHAWVAAGDGNNARRVLAPVLAAESGAPDRVRVQAWLMSVTPEN